MRAMGPRRLLNLEKKARKLYKPDMNRHDIGKRAEELYEFMNNEAVKEVVKKHLTDKEKYRKLEKKYNKLVDISASLLAADATDAAEADHERHPPPPPPLSVSDVTPEHAAHDDEFHPHRLSPDNHAYHDGSYVDYHTYHDYHEGWYA